MALQYINFTALQLGHGISLSARVAVAVTLVDKAKAAITLLRYMSLDTSCPLYVSVHTWWNKVNDGEYRHTLTHRQPTARPKKKRSRISEQIVISMAAACQVPMVSPNEKMCSMLRKGNGIDS